jgi:hypothetical protein
VYVVVLVGVTVIVAPLILLLQLYISPPLALNIEYAPSHMLDGFAFAIMSIVVLTFTVTVAVFAQPALEIPVTVYVDVLLGATVIDAPLMPLLQLYVLPPLALKTEFPPIHILEGLANAVTVGNGFTVTLTVAVPVHPAVLVPVTV